LVTLLSFLLLACAGAPPEAPIGPAAPAQWEPNLDAGEAAAWAPLLDPALLALQQRALEANTDIRRAALVWQAAQIQAKLQGLRLQPSLSLSYNANRALQSEGATVDGYSASAGTGFDLDLWNRLAHLDTKQAALTVAARSDIAAAHASIASQVAESYWTIVANQRFAAIASAKLEHAERAVPLVTARVREGKLLPLEIGKAAAAELVARQQLGNAIAEVAKARVSLARLLDEPPPGPDLAAVALPTRLPTWAPDEPPQVLERRPDVHRARLEVDAALAEVRATRAARYPQLTFSAGIGTGGARLTDWLGQPLLSLASNLTVPLVDWRRVDLQEAQSRNALDSAALNLRDKVHGALAEVQTLLIEQRRIAEARAAADKQLEQAREADRIARLKLDVGAIALADWLQARIATSDAEQAVEQARRDAVRNRRAMLRALVVPRSDDRS
jgi:outer membrane protein TolC